MLGGIMNEFKNLILLREYCRKNEWPRLPQWQHWIYARKPIAQQCIKKVAGRYLIDLTAFEAYIANASLEENQ